MRGTRGTVVLAISDTHAEDLPEARPVTIGTLPALGHLRDRIIKAGFDFVALRDAGGTMSEPLYVLWDFGSFAILPRSLRRVPPDRVIAWSLESPLVAHRAYHRLDAIAARSRRVLTFPGVISLLKDSNSFRSVLYPNEPVPFADRSRWSERGFLVLISTNKTVRPSWRSADLARPYRSLRRIAAGILATSYGLRRRWAAPDLYPERVKAIEHFSQRDDFVLFGGGWSASPRRGHSASAVARSYRGPVPDKHGTLRDFRFGLCFENTRFPGYITEKLFDCLYARTIPIYLGAPDITDYVPSDVFIDREDFRSYEDLEAFIAEMQPGVADAYLDAGEAFLGSGDARVFDSERFVQDMMFTLEEAANSA